MGRILRKPVSFILVAALFISVGLPGFAGASGAAIVSASGAERELPSFLSEDANLEGFSGYEQLLAVYEESTGYFAKGSFSS